MDKIVSEHFARKHALKPIENTNGSIILIDSLKKINGFCKSDYKSFFTLPLLVYFYSNEKICCRLNPKIYSKVIITEINEQMNRNVDQKKVNGKTIEIVLNSIPTSFFHHYNEHFVIMQYTNFSVSKDEVYNENGRLRINYIIRDEKTGQILKKGHVEEEISANNYRKAYNERRKAVVRNFLTDFDNNLQSSCRQIAQSLVNEINNL